MFYEAEQTLLENKDANVAFAEAPTGSGKSNLAMNCSLKLLDKNINKIFYVYPFNTLVEQNYDTLEKIYGQTDIFKSIAVINSITPIPLNGTRKFWENLDKEENEKFYQIHLVPQYLLSFAQLNLFLYISNWSCVHPSLKNELDYTQAFFLLLLVLFFHIVQ